MNKLGDPQRRTASNAAHVLIELVSKEHPAMKRVVAREVESFCFRRGVGLKAQYYAAVLLNQFPLNHTRGHEKLAAQLVEFYFALFQMLHKSGASGTEARKTKTPRRQSRRRRLPLAEVPRAAAAAAAEAADAADGEAGDGRALREGVHAQGGARAPPPTIGSGVDARVVSALAHRDQPRVSLRRR